MTYQARNAVVVLVGLALIAGLFLIAKRTTTHNSPVQNTVTWKKYQSDNFSFLYPAEWGSPSEGGIMIGMINLPDDKSLESQVPVILRSYPKTLETSNLVQTKIADTDTTLGYFAVYDLQESEGSNPPQLVRNAEANFESKNEIPFNQGIDDHHHYKTLITLSTNSLSKYWNETLFKYITSTFTFDGSNFISGDAANLVYSPFPPRGNLPPGITKVEGSIKGGYFFEATARGMLLDADKNILKKFQLKATTDWMTSEPVTFTASIDATGLSGSGYIRLANDNPSGDPARDKYIDIPVRFE